MVSIQTRGEKWAMLTRDKNALFLFRSFKKIVRKFNCKLTDSLTRNPFGRRILTRHETYTTGVYRCINQ